MAHIDCICPRKADGEPRHPDGDDVELRERLDFRGLLTARNAFAYVKQEDPNADWPEVLAVLSEQYLLLGIRDWTVVDARGKRIEPSKAAIREHLLSNPDEAIKVADEADDLYTEAVLAPLVARALNSSAPTPISASTSATNGSAKTPRTRSRPSSTSTTQTAGIVTSASSHAGGSTSSPKSASADWCDRDRRQRTAT